MTNLLNRDWGLPRQAIDRSLAISPEPPKPIENMSLAKVEAELAALCERQRLIPKAFLCASLSIQSAR
jgi:hypothetical protein